LVFGSKKSVHRVKIYEEKNKNRIGLSWSKLLRFASFFIKIFKTRQGKTRLTFLLLDGPAPTQSGPDRTGQAQDGRRSARVVL
jgi:hypothetical protein